MPAFYTVDRIGRLHTGDTLDLVQHADVQPPFLQAHVDDLFPRGVSAHGERYFLQAASGFQLADPAVELIFEYVRRAKYPDRPSRFESVFGCLSPADAATFRATFGSPGDKIWEVESDHWFQGNMRLLHGKNSILVVSYLASQYWQGTSGPAGIDVLWECLLVPPVRVIRLVP